MAYISVLRSSLTHLVVVLSRWNFVSLPAELHVVVLLVESQTHSVTLNQRQQMNVLV